MGSEDTDTGDDRYTGALPHDRAGAPCVRGFAFAIVRRSSLWSANRRKSEPIPSGPSTIWKLAAHADVGRNNGVSFPLEGIRRPDDGKRKLTPLSRKWATGFRVVPRRASPRV